MTDKQPTIKQVKDYVKTNCPSVKLRYDSYYAEFRLSYHGLSAEREEAIAAYCTDRQEAIDTATQMEQRKEDWAK
jgi:hypothetical protein